MPLAVDAVEPPPLHLMVIKHSGELLFCQDDGSMLLPGRAPTRDWFQCAGGGEWP